MGLYVIDADEMDVFLWDFSAESMVIVHPPMDLWISYVTCAGNIVENKGTFHGSMAVFEG